MRRSEEWRETLLGSLACPIHVTTSATNTFFVSSLLLAPLKNMILTPPNTSELFSLHGREASSARSSCPLLRLLGAGTGRVGFGVGNPKRNVCYTDTCRSRARHQLSDLAIARTRARARGQRVTQLSNFTVRQKSGAVLAPPVPAGRLYRYSMKPHDPVRGTQHV